jgi:hypothetical protein
MLTKAAGAVHMIPAYSLISVFFFYKFSFGCQRGQIRFIIRRNWHPDFVGTPAKILRKIYVRAGVDREVWEEMREGESDKAMDSH